MAWLRSEVYEGEGSEWEPPVSRAEQLMKAHPDIKAIRGMFGDIRIMQSFPDRWRRLRIDVKHEKDSQRHYPSVVVKAYETPPHTSLSGDLDGIIQEYGLITIVKLHTGDDEQVTPEVGYDKQSPYPRVFRL